MLKVREFESHGFLVLHWHVCGNNLTFPICFSISLHESGSFVYRSTSFFPQAELCLITLNMSRKHVIMILTSAVRLFILLSYTTLLSKTMGMRRYRELSTIVTLTRPCIIFFAHGNPFGARITRITLCQARLGGQERFLEAWERRFPSPLCRFPSLFLRSIDCNSCSKTHFTLIKANQSISFSIFPSHLCKCWLLI